jgi:hypothetical protein
MHRTGITILALGALGLAGCATPLLSPTVTATPRPYESSDVFQMDRVECTNYADRQIAPRIEAANNRAAASVALDAGFAGLGAIAGAQDAASAGSIWESDVGSSDTSDATNPSLQQRYDFAYAQCMSAKGNNVPAFATPAGERPRMSGTGG